MLIRAVSQIVEAADQNLRTSRFFRFRPYQLLVAIGRGPGQSQYMRLKQAVAAAAIYRGADDDPHGANWRRMQFSWINSWEERVDARGQSHSVEFVLPEWFYRVVLDRSLVLTIDPTYFAPTGGIEHRLYRVARHAGHQARGWAFELRHLYAKSGSAARFSDFAFDLRRIRASERAWLRLVHRTRRRAITEFW